MNNTTRSYKAGETIPRYAACWLKADGLVYVNATATALADENFIGFNAGLECAIGETVTVIVNGEAIAYAGAAGLTLTDDGISTMCMVTTAGALIQHTGTNINCADWIPVRGKVAVAAGASFKVRINS